MVIKRIGVWSVSKLFGGLYGLLGLLGGGVMSALSLFGALGAVVGGDTAQALPGLIFGVGAVVFLPLIYGGMGFFAGALMAVFYNVAARLLGGIEIEVE